MRIQAFRASGQGVGLVAVMALGQHLDAPMRARDHFLNSIHPDSVIDHHPNLTFYISEDLWASISFSLPLVLAFFFFVVGLIVWRLVRGSAFTRFMEIDEAEIGIGDQKIRLKPNEVDRQIAYQVWVELSTRKIGLEIDPDHDVISEIYDSWYSFFSVTRELIKDVPATKISSPSPTGSGPTPSPAHSLLSSALRCTVATYVIFASTSGSFASLVSFSFRLFTVFALILSSK